jgi:hypothetical protein
MSWALIWPALFENGVPELIESPTKALLLDAKNALDR